MEILIFSDVIYVMVYFFRFCTWKPCAAGACWTRGSTDVFDSKPLNVASFGPSHLVLLRYAALYIYVSFAPLLMRRASAPTIRRYATVSEGNGFECHINMDKIKVCLTSHKVDGAAVEDT